MEIIIIAFFVLLLIGIIPFLLLMMTLRGE